MTSRKPRRAHDKRASTRTETSEPKRATAVALPRPAWWLVAALAAATLLAYLPALNAPFVLDDRVTIDAASHWESARGMPTAGRPLVTATLGLNYQLNRVLGVNQDPDPGGTKKAVGYRLFNVLLHLLTGALLFGVLRRAMRERAIAESWRAVADPIAAIVCALWLLHPIQSEVIDYVVQRSESLASLFYLAVLYASQRAWESAAERRGRWYGAAIVACVLGMLCKEVVITAPLAVMLYDRAFRVDSWRALMRPAHGRGWLYAALWGSSIATFALVAAGTRGGSPDLNLGVTWYGYLYTQCWAIAHYLRLVIWPNALAADYGFRTIRGMRGIPGLGVLLVFAAATLLAWTRAERFGWFAFAGSMFFILLAPSSSVVPVVLEVAAERRIYLALAVVLTLMVVGAEWVRRRLAPALSPRWLPMAAAGITVALGVATWSRNQTYRDPEALWRSTVRAVPENSRAMEQLALAVLQRPAPNVAEAESAFVKALATDSSCQSGCLQYGSLLTKQGRYVEAIPYLRRQASEDEGTRFNFLATRLVAFDLMKQGDYKDAIPYLERVVALQPTLSHLVALGVSYLSVGRTNDAVATFRYMATFDPGSAELQRLSAKLEDGVRHPEALPNLQEVAFQMAHNWVE